MAFCRLGADGSDVYCFYSTCGYYEVWSCEGEHHFDTAQETIDFLKALKEKGENIPDYAFDSLEADT
jgi:hypothetical protein